MLKELPELAPTSVIIAAIAWGGLSYFITGPEIAARIARADYLPRCERTVSEVVERGYHEEAEGLSRQSDAETVAPMLGDYVDRMGKSFPEQTAFLDMITGGTWSMALDMPRQAAIEAQKARDQARAALRRRAEAAIANAPDQCSCQVRAALAESQTDWALYAGSFGLIEREQVTEFPGLMSSHTRTCAERIGS